jgi:hypothetical protein
VVVQPNKPRPSLNRPVLGYVEGFDGELRPGDSTRFYRVRLLDPELTKLCSFLEVVSEGERACRIITATGENVNRLRVMTRSAPAYELRAGREYVRGDVLTVRGKTSLNIFVRIPDGGRLLQQRFEAARQQMRQWVELRANRVRNLVEIFPDTDLPSSEDVKLGQTGQSLAAAVWPDEDFRDWESADA